MNACVHWSDHNICLIVENAFANNRKIKSICAEAPNYLMCVKMWTMRWMKGGFDVFETIDLLKCHFGWLETDAYGNCYGNSGGCKIKMNEDAWAER